MSKNKRKDIRLGPDEIMKYRVSLEKGPDSVDCYMRNISESGMNIILPNDDSNLDLIQKENILIGGVEGIDNQIYFDFKASVVWFEIKKMHDQDFIIAGVRFEPGYILPRSFYEELDPVE